MAGILIYFCAESLRFLGFSLPIISPLTKAVIRRKEQDRLVLGPVTLGLGALLVLLIFPPQPAAAAIYALAFGDSAASLAGKFLGKWRPAFLFGKSIEGSVACFAVVLFSAYAVCGNVNIALAAAFTAMIIEAMPLEDYDNLAIPVVVGLVVKILMVLS